MENTETQRSTLEVSLAAAKQKYGEAAEVYSADPTKRGTILVAKNEVRMIEDQIEALDVADRQDAKRRLGLLKEEAIQERAAAVKKVEALLKEWTNSFSKICQQLEKLGKTYREFTNLPIEMSEALKCFGGTDRAAFIDRLVMPSILSEMLGTRMAVMGLSDVATTTPGAWGRPDVESCQTHEKQVNQKSDQALSWLNERLETLKEAHRG